MATTTRMAPTKQNANMKKVDDYCRRKARGSLGMRVDEEQRQEERLERGLEAPSSIGGSSSGAQRVFKQNKSNEHELGRVTPNKLFQEEQHLMAD